MTLYIILFYITLLNLRIQPEHRKIRTRKTPYLDSFHAVITTIIINVLLKLIFSSSINSHGKLITSRLICATNQLTGFYIKNVVLMCLKLSLHHIPCIILFLFVNLKKGFPAVLRMYLNKLHLKPC